VSDAARSRRWKPGAALCGPTNPAPAEIAGVGTLDLDRLGFAPGSLHTVSVSERAE
jgi:hypothetical protein